MGFYSTYMNTKHYGDIDLEIFTELKMKYNGEWKNTWKPKDGRAWWITSFDTSTQNIAEPAKIGFRCEADLSVLKEDIRNKFKDKIENRQGWTLTGNTASFKWDYK